MSYNVGWRGGRGMSIKFKDYTWQKLEVERLIKENVCKIKPKSVNCIMDVNVQECG